MKYRELEYTVHRSDRKTAVVYVNKDGGVEVRCPHCFGDNSVKEMLERFYDRLKLKSDELTALARERRFTPSTADTLLYLGREVPLVKREGGRVGYDKAAEVFFIPYGCSDESVKAALVKVYKQLAREYLVKRTAELSAVMERCPKSVKINEAHTRWGSCSSKSSINFSWYLITAEPDLIDLVICHELSHMSEMNHSPAFYAILDKYISDRKEKEKRLKSLAARLNAEDW